MSNSIERIAMISTHGYFDPVPTLGQTDTGGQVMYVLNLAKALSRKGIPTDIYTRWFDKSKKQVDPVPGYDDVRVIRIAGGPWEFIPKEFLYDHLPEIAANMVRFIRDNDIEYDLIHGHYCDAGIVALDVAKALKKPVYFTLHSLGAWKRDQMGGDPEEMERKFNFKRREAEELRIFQAVNAQTTTTDMQQEKMKDLMGFQADNVVTIPCGVDVQTFCLPTEENKKVKTDLPEKYIFCLSRIDTNKGHDMLLYAYDVFRRKVDGVDLVIGGGSPSPKPRELGVFENMRRIIKQKGMQNRVHILGYVPDELVVPYYQRSQLFVVPSKFEPFGMTAQEAMACGKAVVASKFGGIKNIITHGHNGMLVDPTDAEQFADAMVKVVTDRAFREKIEMNAAETILKTYSWDAIADRHLAFYRQFMHRKA
jgi:mannosylfructose-phosphate synthase